MADSQSLPLADARPLSTMRQDSGSDSLKPSQTASEKEPRGGAGQDTITKNQTIYADVNYFMVFNILNKTMIQVQLCVNLTREAEAGSLVVPTAAIIW